MLNDTATPRKAVLALLLTAAFTTASAQEEAELRYGVLVPSGTTMVTAWTFPKNPLEDTLLAVSPRSELVRNGYKLFIATPREAPQFAGNDVSCNNCHLNAGQRERALPLVGIANVFPEYNKREGRTFTLEDRIIGCFLRSENGTGVPRTQGTPPLSPAPSRMRWSPWLRTSPGSRRTSPVGRNFPGAAKMKLPRNTGSL